MIAVPGGSGLCTKRRALVKKLINEAISGDAKDASALISLCARLFPDSDEADPRAAEDDAFVEKLAERERRLPTRTAPSLPRARRSETMNETTSPLRNFEFFVRMVFRHENDGKELGDEPYIGFICDRVQKVSEEGARLVINMPPRHLKTSIGTVSVSAWLLGLNPAEKIQIFTYSAQLADEIGYRIREVLRSTWFKRHFQTRLTSDRASVTDFATTAGGGVYAASASGSFIGRGATVIIFDDPLDMDDAGNLEKREKINQRFDSAIMSRLNDSKIGRVVINGHRLHEDDLSGHVLAMGGWDLIALSFEAPRDELFSFGGRSWHRKPDYEALYQQFLGESHSLRISRDQFGSFAFAPKDAPILITVDPGHRGGPGHSFTVMQAWSPCGNEFLLLDQWREQTDVEEACWALKVAAKKLSTCYRPDRMVWLWANLSA